MSEPITQAAIQARAYQLWEESGCGDGSHEEHWRRAEAEFGEASTVKNGDGAAATSGTDGETSKPLSDVKPSPQRWPAPIVDV